MKEERDTLYVNLGPSAEQAPHDPLVLSKESDVKRRETGDEVIAVHEWRHVIL